MKNVYYFGPELNTTTLEIDAAKGKRMDDLNEVIGNAKLNYFELKLLCSNFREWWTLKIRKSTADALFVQGSI